MHKSLLPAVLCGLLLVTAGCTGLTGTESPADVSATPADVPEDEHTAAYPPGVTAQGVENSTSLLNAHLYADRNSTQHSSFNLSFSKKEVTLGPGENSVQLQVSQHVTANTSTNSYLRESTANGTRMDHNNTVHWVAYQNQTKWFYRSTIGDETQSHTFRPRPEIGISEFVISKDFSMIWNADDWNVTRIEGTEDQFRLQSNSLAENSTYKDPDSPVSGSNFTIDMVVRSDGTILDYEYSIERTKQGETTRTTTEYELSSVDEPISIEKPDWVSEVNKTSEQPGDEQATTASS